MANKQTPVAFEPFFGGFVLETLTIGMYGEARNAIRGVHSEWIRLSSAGH